MRNSNYNNRGGVGGRSNMNERPNRNTFNNRDNGLYLFFVLKIITLKLKLSNHSNSTFP